MGLRGMFPRRSCVSSASSILSDRAAPLGVDVPQTTSRQAASRSSATWSAAYRRSPCGASRGSNVGNAHWSIARHVTNGFDDDASDKANPERRSGNLPSSPPPITVDMARKSVRVRKVRYKGHTVRVKVYRRNGRIVRLKVIKSPVKVKRKVLIRRIRRR